METADFNKVIEIYNKLKALKTLQKKLRNTSNSACKLTFIHYSNYAGDELVDKDYLNCISDILMKHQYQIESEINNEIDRLNEEIKKF